MRRIIGTAANKQLRGSMQLFAHVALRRYRAKTASPTAYLVKH